MPIVINGSTGISGTDGSAATPAVQGTDTNTGMFFPAADQIAFAEGGVEAMRIDASGNVGIGTSAPTARLQAIGTSGNRQALFGTAGGYVEVNAFDANPVYCVVNGSNHTAAVFGTQSNTPTIFFTNNTERVRIASGGDFSVGTGSSLGKMTMLWDNAVQQGFALSAASGTFNGSPIVFYNSSGGVSGFIGQAASSVTYNTGSDYRLKHDVAPLAGGLATIAALKPSTYKWNADNSHGEGFIAHELAEHIPLAVSGEKDAVNEDGSIKPQGVDYSKVVVHLVAAVQELTAKLEAAEARIATLEAR